METTTSRISSKSNMNTSRTLSKNKITTSRTLSKNKMTTSRTLSKSNTTQQIKTDKQKDNGIKKKIKQTSRIVVPIGALLLLLKVRKPLKKKVHAFFKKKLDVFLKKKLNKYIKNKIEKFSNKTEIAERIKQLAIEEYDKEVPFITDIEREQDERYLSKYYKIADQEWKKFKETNEE